MKNYEVKIKAIRTGNWLDRHARVLTADGVDLIAVDADITKFYDFITLRNCVVHHWGKVDAARNPNVVKAAANNIETAEISRDGYLYFGDQVMPEAIDAAERIADHILVSQLDVSMT